MLRAEQEQFSTGTILERAGDWLLRSGIQEANGGVARYYRTDTRENASISTEITGYAVSAYLYLYQRTQAEPFLQAALHSGRFLTRTAWNEDLQIFPFEYGGKDHLAYFFDSGIIVRGLVWLARVTRDSEFSEAALKAGESMASDFRGIDGTIHPIVETSGKKPLPHAAQWSRGPGCYQLKSALAWHDLWELSGESRWLDLYREALSKALLSKDHFLPAGTPEQTMDRLHAYCYFLEALLPVVSEPVASDALIEGIGRVAGYLEKIAPQFVRSDVYAQLLRVRLLARQLGGIELNARAAAAEVQQIATFQFEDSDRRIDNGFWFGRKAGSLLPFVNPVSTAFCLQAVDMYHCYPSSDFPLADHRSLI